MKCLEDSYTAGGYSPAARFMIQAADGTMCRLAIVTRQSDEVDSESTVTLEMDGLIGSRETVDYLLERIHRLYPKSEFAQPTCERSAA